MLRGNTEYLTSSLKALSHQFLQRCSVSGTAKGKAKIKAGQPKKRSVVSTRKGKGAPSSSPGGGGRMNEAMKHMSELVDACLSATTPVRYLTPKEREREAEREKLGLISKGRQREIEMLKRQKNEKSTLDQLGILGTPGLDLISLGLVDADKIPKYELTAEDGKRLAKDYSRVLMRRHREIQAAESRLLKNRKAAIEALPEHLRAAALVADSNPLPPSRFLATLTPPIEGYVDKINEAAKRNVGKEKLR